MKTVSLEHIKTMAEQTTGEIRRIFLHWSAGHYGQFFEDYHINIDFDGSIIITTQDLTEVKAHTWHQNTGSIGISLACAYQATTDNMGPEPPTIPQLESMARVVKTLCNGLQITCDFMHVRTHAEQADIDEYGPATTCERWDGWFWIDGDPKGEGGNKIRAMANAS